MGSASFPLRRGDLYVFLEFRGAALGFWLSNRFKTRPQFGKKLIEAESGNQDELNSEQEGRKSEPRAAEKRPKSTERHLGDA